MKGGKVGDAAKSGLSVDGGDFEPKTTPPISRVSSNQSLEGSRASKASSQSGVSSRTVDLSIPVAATLVKHLRPEVLSHLLAECEPVALDVVRLAKMAPRGQKWAPKHKLLELFENLSGWSGEDRLPGLAHDYRILATSLKNYNQQRQRPLRDIMLPPSWPTDGVYALKFQDSKLLVYHKYLQVSHLIPEKFCKDAPLADFTIDKNWSEKNATLIHPTNAQTLQFFYLFQGELVGEALTMEAGDGDPDLYEQDLPHAEPLGEGSLQLVAKEEAVAGEAALLNPASKAEQKRQTRLAPKQAAKPQDGKLAGFFNMKTLPVATADNNVEPPSD